MKRALKICIGFSLGVILVEFAMSWWRDTALDWQTMISLIIGGLIGILIVFGIRKEIKKAKDRTNE